MTVDPSSRSVQRRAPTRRAGAPTRSIGDRDLFPIALGGAAWSFRPEVDADRATAVVEAALGAGVGLLDTAACYTTATESAHNERLIRSILASLGRSDVLVATKGGEQRAGDAFVVDGRPATLRRQVEQSLTALGVERIDLYHLHRVDPAVAIEESVGALAELRDEGKIALLGLSNADVAEVVRASGTTRIDSVQNAFSPFDQRHLDLLAWCESRSTTFFAYSPLGGWAHAAYEAALPGPVALAREHGVSIQRLVLAWELALSPVLVPIVGASRASTARDGAAAAALALTDEEVRSISDAVAGTTS